MRRILPLIASMIAALLSISVTTSCENSVSDIGQSLITGEVTIIVDSLPTNLHGTTEWVDTFDSKTTTKLIGRINVPEYGSLSTSFVTQLLCSTKMNIPDSITEEKIDSMCFIMRIPRGSLTGDSLAPQQLRVFRMKEDIPSSITSAYDPAGKYYPTPLGARSYTVSNIALSDSAFKNSKTINVPVKIDNPEYAKAFFRAYRNNDPIFEWPQSFNEKFKGIYVEQNFGNGCIANITGVQGYLYWNRTQSVAYTDSDIVKYRDVIVRDSICLLASQPEVLSSTNINYKRSETLKNMANEGKTIVTSPGGYITHIRFPIDSLLSKYRENNTQMAVVAALTLRLPAKVIKNDYGIYTAPYLLMIKESEREQFFAQNKIPDNISSFTAAYDESAGAYNFLSMRNYFLKILDDIDSGKQIQEEDMQFTLVPVSLTTETVNNYYGASTTYILKCSPYIEKPSMTELDTENAIISFTFSTQELE